MKTGMRYVLAICVCLVAVVAFSQGNAQAEEPNVPHFIQDYYDDHDLKMANFVWFPFTATTRVPKWPWNWETYIFISNFEGNAINVNAWATNWGEAPTIKQYTLAPYEKKILQLQNWGFFNTVADVWVTSANLMGAAAIIFDAATGDLLTALPPIDR